MEHLSHPDPNDPEVPTQLEKMLWRVLAGVVILGLVLLVSL